jgi:diguanylate cyclase (GGDEF)-like protein/PAS domain S-box-containing protein
MKFLPRLKSLLSLIGLAAVYFVAGKLCLRLAFYHPSASPIWAPTGIAIATFLMWGPRVWPALFVGAFLVNITTYGSLLSSVGIAAGNTLEGAVAAWMVNRWAGGPRVFEESDNVLRYVVFAGLLSPMLSATLGVASLMMFGYAPASHALHIGATWWSGDVGGALIAAPPLLLWKTKPDWKWTPKMMVEAFAICLYIFLLCMTVFGGLVFAKGVRVPLGYLCFFPIIWTAYRFGLRETMGAVLATCMLTIGGTLYGYGPFVRTNPNDSLLFMNVYLDMLAITGLFLASVMRERRLNEIEVREAKQVLEHRVQERTQTLESMVLQLQEEVLEHLQTEKRLKDSEERFRLLVESSKEYAIFMLDTEGNVATWNTGGERIKGYMAADIIGRHFSIFYTPEDIAAGKPQRALKTAMEKGQNRDIGLRVRKDGSTFWVDATLTALYDSYGRLRGFAKVSRDITERMLAEKEIRRYQDIVSNTQIGVVVMRLESDPDARSLRLLSANPAASQILGISMASTMAHSLDAEFPDLYKTPLPAMLAEVARTGKPVDFGEFRYGDTRVKEGVFMIKAFSLPDQCVGVTFENITEQRRTEQALSDSEERFKQLVRSNIIGFMIQETSGQVLEANDAMLKLLGYDREELLAKKLEMTSLISPSYGSMQQWMDDRLRVSGMCPPMELEFVRKDNCHVPALLGMVQLQGTAAHRLCFVIDVTERRSAQEALRKAYDELETRVEQRTAELQAEVLRREHAEEELRNQAIRDSLTGLYNRRGFQVMAESYLPLSKRQKKTLLMFMADVDDLKWINDHLGHAEGDAALIAAADLLRKTFRESDILARLGGDEFAVIGLEDTGQTEAHFKERLEKLADDYNRYSGKTYRIHLSLGATRVDSEHRADMETLMKQADAMLYEQKRHKTEGILKPKAV